MSATDLRVASTGILRDLDTVGIVTVNSPGYVRAMLDNLGSGRVSVPLAGAGDRERLERTGTGEVITPEEGSGWLEGGFTSQGGDVPAQISFTSGTEGAPKAVLLSRGNLHDVVLRLREIMEITPEIREYIGVPVHHSFGYARARSALDAGGACYIPPRGFDLAEIRQMLRAGEINAISAVPSLWRLFLEGRDIFGDELASVRWVEIGSQYMSAGEKSALRAVLPNARIVQHYGLTEASRTTLQRIDGADPATLGSVGRALGGVEVRISAAGRIEIRGPHVALGVLDGETWRPLGAEAWLETGDTGRIEDGLLWFEGRADDVINCGGIKLSPDLLEATVRAAVPGAGDFGLLRRPDPLRGEGIGLVLGSDAGPDRERLLDAVITAAAAQGVRAQGAVSVLEAADLPRTATGKLRRAELARRLEAAEATVVHAAGVHSAGAKPSEAAAARSPENFTGLLTRLLGADPAPGRSFAEYEADSLAHMQVNLALERALGAAPPGWEWRPLDALQAEVAAAGDFQALMKREAGAPPLPDGTRNENPADIPFWSLVAEDFRTNDASIFHQGFLMLFVHRFGNVRMAVRWKILRAPLTVLYRFLNKLTQLFFGMKLDYTVKVGRRVKLEHFSGMILGAREIGDDVIIRQNTTFGIRSTADLNAKPVIGRRVDIGAGAVIVGNVTVGDDAIVGANSVVFTNVPEGAVVMGVPARVIGTNPRQNPSP